MKDSKYEYLDSSQGRTLYMFAPYQGATFLNEWKETRLKALAQLSTMPLRSPDRTALELSYTKRGGIDVEQLLRYLSNRLHALTFEDYDSIEMLRRRYEATHVLRIAYSSLWRKLTDEQISAQGYLLFGWVLANVAQSTTSLTYRVQLLNCLLKINDRCIALLPSTPQICTHLLVEALQLEVQLVVGIQETTGASSA